MVNLFPLLLRGPALRNFVTLFDEEPQRKLDEDAHGLAVIIIAVLSFALGASFGRFSVPQPQARAYSHAEHPVYGKFGHLDNRCGAFRLVSQTTGSQPPP
jgi:hypothetical protein